MAIPLRNLIVALLFLSGAWLPAQNSLLYPEVMAELLKNYAIEQLPYFTLAKTPKSWNIITYKIASDGVKPDKSLVFYKGKFRKVDLPKRHVALPADSVNRLLPHYLTNWYDYERCVYFGYPEWTTDVIRKLERKKNLNIEELESLSRAYSRYSTNFILRKPWPEEARPKDEGRSGWTGERAPDFQVKQFVYYKDLSLAAIDRMIAIDPNYEVLVGHIRNKKFTETMDAVVKLLMAGHPEKAEYFLRKAEPDSLLLSYAYNLFRGLPKHALLFTDSDNDTYPLWYLQLTGQVAFRNKVVNLSMLGLNDYVHLLNSAHRVLGGVRMNGYANYRNETHENDYVGIPGSQGETTRADDLIRLLYTNNVTWNSRPGGKVMAVGVADTLCWYSATRSYLIKSEVHILDIFESYPFECYATEAAANTMRAFYTLTLSGFNYQLAYKNLEAARMIDSAGVGAWFMQSFRKAERDARMDPNRRATADMFGAALMHNLALALDYARMHGERSMIELLIQQAAGIYPEQMIYPANDGSEAVELLLALYRAGARSETERLLTEFLSLASNREKARRARSSKTINYDALQRYQSLVPALEKLIQGLEAETGSEYLTAQIRASMQRWPKD